MIKKKWSHSQCRLLTYPPSVAPVRLWLLYAAECNQSQGRFDRLKEALWRVADRADHYLTDTAGHYLPGVMRRNRRNAAAFRIEREQLRDLPPRRATDFVEEEGHVTRCGTFTVGGILYSAPSRLIGHRLKVRLFSDRLDCYLAGSRVLTRARGTRSAYNGRGRVIDYRHFVDELKRKPQAFKGLLFRDALFPREAYRRTWEQLELQLPRRQACQVIVALLEMAARDGVEARLAERLDALLERGELPDVKQLREEFAPRQIEVPQVTVEIPAPGVYDALLPSRQVDERVEVSA